MEAVQNAVHNGVERFSQSPQISSNELAIGHGGSYRFPARTREELIQSEQMAADRRVIGVTEKFSQLRDPAKLVESGESHEEPIQRRDDGSVPWML